MSHENPDLISPTPQDPHEAIQPDSPDFRETPDIDPLSGETEHFPVWTYIVCGVALFLAGTSFTGFSTFGQGLLDQGPGGPTMAASGTDVQKPLSPAEIGKKLYAQNCANCHQATGMGQPGVYPPMAGSEWVTGSKERLTLILLAGLNGPLSVKGDSYGAQVMPAWATVFTDEKLANLLTYLRSDWGNKADAITADEVAAVRAKHNATLGTACTQSMLEGMK
jgi:mono/diheme cytochrome c family protein